MQTNQLKKAQEYVTQKCLERFDVDKSNYLLPIWKLNLAVILEALRPVFEQDYHKMIFQDGRFFFICAENPVCQFYWQLMTKTGLEVLFEGQSEKDQLAIAKLLGFKEGEGNEN